MSALDHACHIISDDSARADCDLDLTDREARVEAAAAALRPWISHALFGGILDHDQMDLSRKVAGLVAPAMLAQHEHTDKLYGDIIDDVTGPKFYISKHAAEILKSYLDTIVKEGGDA
jgi:hypothetical protein